MRAPVSRRLLAGLAAAWLSLTYVGGAIDEPGLGNWIFGVAVTVVVGVWALGVARPSVQVVDGTLVSRGCGPTRRVALSEIRSIEVRSNSLYSAIAVAVLSSGETYQLPAVSTVLKAKYEVPQQRVAERAADLRGRLGIDGD